MHEYTWRNYLRWGYEDGVAFQEPPDEPERIRMWFDIEPTLRHLTPAMSIRYASLQAARTILHRAETLNMPVSLSLSGGIDSEAMLVSFILAAGNRPTFTCTILRFNDGINWHETELAVRLCEDNQIAYEFVDLNLFEFWYRLPPWMEKFRLASGIQYTSLYEYAARPGIFFVRGGNPILRVDRNNPTHVGFEMYSATTVVERYWRSVNHPGVPRFHLYTPSQMLAWLNHPVVQAWQKQLRGSEVYSFSKLKPIIYQMEFPEIAHTRKKWTGSELLTNHINDLWFRQWGKNLPYNPAVQRPINEMIAELKG